MIVGRERERRRTPIWGAIAVAGQTGCLRTPNTRASAIASRITGGQRETNPLFDGTILHPEARHISI